jgi:hypothetical protein
MSCCIFCVSLGSDDVGDDGVGVDIFFSGGGWGFKNTSVSFLFSLTIYQLHPTEPVTLADR